MDELVQLVRRDHATVDDHLVRHADGVAAASPAELADVLDRHRRFLAEVVWPAYEGCVGTVPDLDATEGRAQLDEVIARLRAADGEAVPAGVRPCFDEHAVAMEQEVLPRILAEADEGTLSDLTVQAMQLHEQLGLGESFPRPMRGAVATRERDPERPAGSGTPADET